MSCGADKALISGQICAVSWLSLCLHVELAALFLDQHKKGDKLRGKNNQGSKNSLALESYWKDDGFLPQVFVVVVEALPKFFCNG